MTDSILRLDELINHIGLSRSAIYDRMNKKSHRYAADFPKSFSLGGRAVGWRKSEIDAWLNTCQGNPDTTPPAQKAKSSSKSSSADGPKPKLSEKSLLQPIAATQVIAPECATPAERAITDVEKIADEPLLKRSQQLDAHLLETEEKVAHWTELLAFGPNNLPAFHEGAGAFIAVLHAKYANEKQGEEPSFSAKTYGGATYHLMPPDDLIRTQNETFAWLANSGHYEILGGRLNKLLNPSESSRHAFRLDASAARQLDLSLTKAFNRVLQRQLSNEQDELRIDSFTMNIDEIIEKLDGNDKHPLALPALRSIQKEFIACNTFVLSGEFRDHAFKNLERHLKSEPVLIDELKTRLTLHAKPFMGALVNCRSDELEIDIKLGSSTVLASKDSQLASLASKLCKIVNPVTNTRSNIIISTTDDYQFELDKLLLHEHHFMFTRIA